MMDIMIDKKLYTIEWDDQDFPDCCSIVVLSRLAIIKDEGDSHNAWIDEAYLTDAERTAIFDKFVTTCTEFKQGLVLADWMNRPGRKRPSRRITYTADFIDYLEQGHPKKVGQATISGLIPSNTHDGHLIKVAVWLPPKASSRSKAARKGWETRRRNDRIQAAARRVRRRAA